jgi:hypothetical protein
LEQLVPLSILVQSRVLVKKRFVIMNRVLFSANTNLRFWSHCPIWVYKMYVFFIINSFRPDLCTSSQESHTEAFRLCSCPHPNRRRRPLRTAFGWTGQGDRSARRWRQRGWWLSLLGRVCVHTARGAVCFHIMYFKSMYLQD